MGQFAADYRRHFGELPSQTLRRISTWFRAHFTNPNRPFPQSCRNGYILPSCNLHGARDAVNKRIASSFPSISILSSERRQRRSGRIARWWIRRASSKQVSNHRTGARGGVSRSRKACQLITPQSPVRIPFPPLESGVANKSYPRVKRQSRR